MPFVVEDAVHHLNKSISLMASQTDCCYLDNFAKIDSRNPDIFKEDDIHLNNRVNDLWARSILEYVAFLFEDD